MRRTCTCKWQGEYMHMQMTGRMKSTSYRMVIWWKWRDIHDENLHFVDKVSLEVRLNLNELSLRLRLHRITANVEVKLNFLFDDFSRENMLYKLEFPNSLRDICIVIATQTQQWHLSYSGSRCHGTEAQEDIAFLRSFVDKPSCSIHFSSWSCFNKCFGQLIIIITP